MSGRQLHRLRQQLGRDTPLGPVPDKEEEASSTQSESDDDESSEGGGPSNPFELLGGDSVRRAGAVSRPG